MDSRRINNNQIFISLDPNVAKNITNINHAIAKGASGFITHLSSFWPEYPEMIWESLKEKDYTKAKNLLGGFKSDQVAAMVASALGGFNSDQVGAMDPSAMAGFQADHFAAIDY